MRSPGPELRGRRGELQALVASDALDGGEDQVAGAGGLHVLSEARAVARGARAGW
jgi:hypothetical protein